MAGASLSSGTLTPEHVSRGKQPDHTFHGPSRLVYGANSDFPPFEYRDSEGQPRGFNVELVRALARELGIEIEVRLIPVGKVQTQLSTGAIDLASLSYSESRARKYDFLDSTWVLRQVVLFRPGRQSPARRLDQMRNETVAVIKPSIMYEALMELPAAHRPVLTTVDSPPAALRLLAEGKVGGVAGNELTLNYSAQQLGMNGLVAVNVNSVSYHLVTQKGRREEFRA